MSEFVGILEFLNKYAGQDYSQNDKELAKYGQLAYRLAELLGDSIAYKLKEFEFVGSSKWQNSGHIAKYFWLQFKRKKYQNRPFSISVGTIKNKGKYDFKVYLEVANNDINIFNGDKDVLRDFNQAILKLEQPFVDFYYEGMTKDKRYDRISTDINSVLQALGSGKYLKITTNININIEDIDTNETILDKICDAFKILIPYYDAIFGDVPQNKNWIIPCNIEKYNVIGAFNKYTSLDWHVSQQTQKIKSGDTVYIYVSAPYSRIMYDCVVEKTGIITPEINDSEFVIDGKWDNSLGYFRIKLVRKLSSLNLSLSDLNDNGVAGNIQGARTITESTKTYIENASKGELEDIPSEEKDVLKKMSETEIEATLNAEDDSSCYEYKEKLVKTRKVNKEIVDRLKKYYKGQCQLCGEFVGKDFDKEIVEAHHIEYFSQTQNNDSSNIIILCPNCHALIHRCDPVYNKKDYSYDFNNGIKIRIKNVGHLAKKD